jgi:hypothetical protein
MVRISAASAFSRATRAIGSLLALGGTTEAFVPDFCFAVAIGVFFQLAGL